MLRRLREALADGLRALLEDCQTGFEVGASRIGRGQVGLFLLQQLLESNPWNILCVIKKIFNCLFIRENLFLINWLFHLVKVAMYTVNKSGSIISNRARVPIIKHNIMMISRLEMHLLNV